MDQSEVERVRRELLSDNKSNSSSKERPKGAPSGSVRERYNSNIQNQGSHYEAEDDTPIQEQVETEDIPIRESNRNRNSGARNQSGKRKKKRKKHKFLKFILSLVILLAIIVAVIYGFIYNMIDSTVNCNILDPSKVKVNAEVSTDIAKETANYRTLALFGVDSRKENLTGNTRTDSIMLISINKKTKDIKVISVYRDTYLNIGNDVYTKCNAAYAKGGPEQALSMLNQNLDLNIEGYITIGFEGLVNAIDGLGGVPITVEDDEVEYLNSYVKSMAKELGTEYTPISSSGKQILNGAQAVAYCRIRYTSGDDYRRTQRQRTVLQAMIKKIKSSSVMTTKDMVESAMKGIVTSMNASDIIQLLPLLVSCNINDTSGMPFEKYRNSKSISGQSCVVPETLEENVILLHEFLYSTKNYKVSQTVKKYSSIIAKQ